MLNETLPTQLPADAGGQTIIPSVIDAIIETDQQRVERAMTIMKKHRAKNRVHRDKLVNFRAPMPVHGLIDRHGKTYKGGKAQFCRDAITTFARQLEAPDKAAAAAADQMSESPTPMPGRKVKELPPFDGGKKPRTKSDPMKRVKTLSMKEALKHGRKIIRDATKGKTKKPANAKAMAARANA